MLIKDIFEACYCYVHIMYITTGDIMYLYIFYVQKCEIIYRLFGSMSFYYNLNNRPSVGQIKVTRTDYTHMNFDSIKTGIIQNALENYKKYSD